MQDRQDDFVFKKGKESVLLEGTSPQLLFGGAEKYSKESRNLGMGCYAPVARQAFWHLDGTMARSANSYIPIFLRNIKNGRKDIV